MKVSYKALPGDIWRCPTCRGPIDISEEEANCTNGECAWKSEAFEGLPILLDERKSIVNGEQLRQRHGKSDVQRGGILRKSLSRALYGTNKVAPEAAKQILSILGKNKQQPPLILVIGGGSIGKGAEMLYRDKDTKLISFDVYASEHLTFIADAHDIPLSDCSVDAVWIQAVLEHVLSPERVVAEIHRLLKPNGLVFSDSPFLWPVHERSYDYIRWTQNGHRWLFRHFDVLSAGWSSGAGTTLVLAIVHFFAGLTHSRKVGHLLALPFAWVRLFDSVIQSRENLDSASGLYLLGRKRSSPIDPRTLSDFYDSQTSPSVMKF